MESFSSFSFDPSEAEGGGAGGKVQDLAKLSGAGMVGGGMQGDGKHLFQSQFWRALFSPT